MSRNSVVYIVYIVYNDMTLSCYGVLALSVPLCRNILLCV